MQKISSSQLSVSIITPTTRDRVHFNRQCELFAQQQDYPNIIEHLFDYGDENVGVKRNNLCAKAQGDVIIHFDSDDFYAPDWISKSVAQLLSLQVPCTGLRQAYFHDIINNNGWIWSYPENALPYLAEATLCYYRSHWMKSNHLDAKTGESTPLYRLSKAHDNIDLFVARLHGSNSSSSVRNSFKPIGINVINSLYNR